MLYGSAVGSGAREPWNWGGNSTNLGAIALAEEQADHLLAVPINYSHVHFASHCRRNADIELSPKSGNLGRRSGRQACFGDGSPSPYQATRKYQVTDLARISPLFPAQRAYGLADRTFERPDVMPFGDRFDRRKPSLYIAGGAYG